MSEDFDLSVLLEAFGDMRFAPPAPAPPSFGDVVPAPRHHERSGIVPIDAPWVSVTGPDAAASAVDVLLEGCFRTAVPAGRGEGGYPVRFAIDPDGPDGEGYTVDADAETMTVCSATSTGLVRGATTARQLVRAGAAGIEVASARIADSPVVPIRMLGGWGLYRDESFEVALEVALEGKYNRILYNWWAATPDERMSTRDEHIVGRARDLGIELVVELRRQALGPRFDPTDESDVRKLLRHYDDAVDRGFRSFGILFDDTDLDPCAAELALVARIGDHVAERLGDEPELFYCPRYYWLPGAMDYSWLPVIAELMGNENQGLVALMGDSDAPRSVSEAKQVQRDFLDEVGARVPPNAYVYLAHWLHGTPDDWIEDLDDWRARTGRRPVFWDNQMMNDYRAGLVYPLPLHQRPAEFARSLDGYLLNSSPPAAAFASGSITSGAWAWNPDGYDAATAFGMAITRCHPGAESEAVDAFVAWGALVDDLMGERSMMEHHYGGLERADPSTIRARLDEIDGLLAVARSHLSHRAAPLSARGLAQLRDETDRLRLDLDLVELAAASDDPTGTDRAARTLAHLRTSFASRLPALSGIRDLLATDADASALGDNDIAGVSWYVHYVLWAAAEASKLAGRAATTTC